MKKYKYNHKNYFRYFTHNYLLQKKTKYKTFLSVTTLAHHPGAPLRDESQFFMHIQSYTTLTREEI